MRVVFLAVLLLGWSASAQEFEGDPSSGSPGQEASGQAASEVASSSAAASQAVSSDDGEAFRELPRAAEARLAPMGVSLDLGIPDFAGLSFNWRPIWLVRAHAGVLFNGVGPGVRAGVTIIPFNFIVTPTLSVEAGRYFGGDGSFLSRVLPIDQAQGGAMQDVLKDLQYTFASAHLGVEVGPPGSFVFYLRAGLSYVDTTLTGSGAAVEEQVNDPNLSVEDFKLRGSIPSLKLGFLFYFG